jgi:VWFA-related protein
MAPTAAEEIIMRRLLIGLPLIMLAAVPVFGQPDAKLPYKIEFNQNDVELRHQSKDGKSGIYLGVRFNVSSQGNDVSAKEGEWQIAVYENNKVAATVSLPEISRVTKELSVVMAIDTSGSMKEHGRMQMARQAAQTFLGNLHTRADCGLVLFDHEVRDQVPPTSDRSVILKHIFDMEPRGGTAFRDAALVSLQMLAAVPKNRDRVLVLMTDGADVNSSHSLDEVISAANAINAKIYTIGIGEPGKFEQVNTTLVLDHSGSMELPADESDLSTPKIKALHAAASAFVQMMSKETGRVSLIPFSSTVKTPRAFTNDREDLKRQILKLTPSGETAVLDAIYTAIATLEADNAPGKRAVVAMTDGIDNSSRRRVEEVIDNAKRANIKLYLLGFGRNNEIDHTTMKRMADETRGQYFHASNKDKLLEIFEKLSIELHDDGIDEVSLTKLAHETGGKYYPAKEVSQLRLILEELPKSLERELREVEIKSFNQRDDGSLRTISLGLGRVGEAPEKATRVGPESTVVVHGLIIAEMHPLIYLVLLAIMGCLIAAPALLRRHGTA